MLRIRGLCTLTGETSLQLLLLDIPQNGFCMGDGAELTADGARTWLSNYTFFWQCRY